MKRFPDRLRQLAAIVVVLGLSQATPRQAWADFAYAFAQQTITNLSVSPTVTTTFTVSAQDATTLNGSGSSNSDAGDPLQAYQGGLPMAPQNFFARYAPGSPPVSPTAPPSFTRGDVLFTGTSPGVNSSAVVSESLINTGLGSPNSETATSGLTVSGNFTLGTSSALTISYNYANDIFVFTTASGTAKANFNFTITIKDASGAVVFASQTNATNVNLAAPPQGAEQINSGMEAVVTPLLAAGTQYTIIFSEQSQTTVTAVPEPGSLSLALLAIGGLIPIGYRMKRRQID